METFDLCVVGAGMIGSAAARHASLNPGTKVCLIGPTEPKTKNVDDKRDIYGAHYDEGRITRGADKDPVWSSLAQRSIARYRELEKQSGIKFYQESGNITVGTENSAYLAKVRNTIDLEKVASQQLNTGEMKSLFPYIVFGRRDEGYYESKNAGNISPRKLVLAEQKIAIKNGCTILNDVVNSVERVAQDGKYIMKVETESGETITSRKVLLTTGAFTTFRNLLPGISPEQNLCPLTVAKVEIDDVDAHRLRSMPSVIYNGDGHPDWSRHFPRYPDDTVSFYMLPPVRYPDGKFYIKLGHFHAAVPKRMKTASEVKQWFCNGNKELADDTAVFIKSLFKDVTFKSHHGDYCVVVETATDRPYVDKVHEQLGVAIGGNGYAAKSCDEIGRIAASMMLSGWDSEIPRETLQLRLASPTKKSVL